MDWSSVLDMGGDPIFSGGGNYLGGGMSGGSAGYDSSSYNGENTGIDSDIANAWWRSIHPGMNGEGIAGGDSNFYSEPPSWFKGGNDPATGRPYSFAPGADFEGTRPRLTSAYDWVMQGTQGSAPGSAGENYQGNIDLFGAYDAPDYDAKWLEGLGYTGAHPNQGIGPDGNPGDMGGQQEFQNWLDSQGLTLGMGLKGDFDKGEREILRLQAFKDGKPFGEEHNWWKDESDPYFQGAIATMAAMFGNYMGATAAVGMGAEAGGMAAGAAGGFGGGLGAGLANYGPTMDALKSAGLGAVSGGFASGVNPAGALGVSDPSWAKPINNAIGSAGRAALTGGDVKDAVLGSLTNSGLSAGLSGVSNMFSGMGGGDVSLPAVDDYSQGFGDYQAPQTDWRSAIGMPGMSTPAAGQGFGLEQYGFQPEGFGNASFVSPQMPTPEITGGSAAWPGSQQNQQQKPGVNPILQRFMPQQAGGASAPGRFDSMAGNLMGLYSAYRNRKMAGRQAGQLQSLFSPNSPYAKQLEQTLMRQDAKAGRRSQVGPRSVELQAKLAEMNSRNAPMLQSLYNQKGAAGDQMLMNLLALGRNGGFQSGVSGLAGLFGYGGGMQGANPTFDYNYQNGSDIGWTPGG